MKLKNRFSLIGLGILIFAIATPLIVLYARGFKYDFATGKIIKTGTLVIKTEPSGALVYLDDQKQANKTPAVIRFLSPRDFQVRLEKDGYQSWTKRLSVNAQYVTWATLDRDAISLFFKSPKPAQTWPAATASFSSSLDEIVFTSENNFAQVLSTNSGQITNLGPLPALGFPSLIDSKLRWSDAAKNYEALISKKRDPLPARLLNEISEGQSDGNHIIFISAGDLYSYDSSQLRLIEHKVTSAAQASDGIWYTTATQLKHLPYSSLQAEVILAQLPNFAAISILWAENRIFLTLDQTLYAFNETLEPIASPVTSVRWDQQTRKLLYGNVNETQLYDPNTKTSQLILRSLSPIAHPVLNISAGYLFYLQDQTIKAIELDSRGGQNVYSIVEQVSPQAQFVVSNNGRRLYLFDQSQLAEFMIR